MTSEGEDRAVDPRLATIEREAADEARAHLARVEAADGQLTRSLEGLAERRAHIAHLTGISAAHSSVSDRIHGFLRAELSGSARGWALLETKVYAEAPVPGILPVAGSGVDDSSVLRAFDDVVALRRAIDLPYVPPGGAKKRMVELLGFLESVRHGSRQEAERIGSQIELARSELARAEDTHTQERRTLLTQLEERRARAEQDILQKQMQALDGTVSIAPYDATHWPAAQDGALATASGHVDPVLLGGLHAEASAREVPADLLSFQVPWLRDLRSQGNLLIPWADEDGRAMASGHAEQIVLRALAAFPPGTLRVAFVDPLGLGSSDASFLALGDHNPDLVHRKVRSSREDIEDLLKDTVATIERITQRYLRGTYSTIDEYNTAAEEIAEPYRLLVIHDYPQQFEKGTSLHLLQRVLENGPRCGVHTVIVASSGTTSEYEPGIDDVRRGTTVDLSGSTPWTEVSSPGTTFRTVLPALVDQLDETRLQQTIAQVVDLVGRAAQESGVTTGIDRALALYEKAIAGGSRKDIPAGSVGSRLEDPTSWWRNSSEHALVAPVGPSTARDAAVIGFDSESTSSALLIGRPGSGKSTLLHTWMSTLTTLYSPQEVELLLVDFKEGVEFAAYARAGLPHASCIAIESEREFGLGVLQEIEGRIRQRSIDFKQVDGATGLESYRRASGRTVPRVVLVFDEFQVLFSQDDRIGLEAARLLEKIIRQGRGFGIHVLLGSQSLSGMVALNRQVVQLISTRVLLPSSADDAALALGENTTAHRTLSARGEGVMTTEPNDPEALLPFRVAYEPDDEREARLHQLRERADAAGFTRRPVVFSSERSVTRDELRSALTSTVHGTADVPVLTPGASVSLAPPPAIRLDREPGRNVIAILRDGDEGDAAFVAGVAEDVLLSTPRSELLLVTLAETPQLDEHLDTLADASRVRVMSRRALASGLAETAQEVRRRAESGTDASTSSRVVLLHGLQRARALDPDAGSGFSFDAEEEEENPLRDLEQILADGPEVGVHVVATADSLGGITRRLSRQALSGFDLRLAGPISPGDAADFLEPGVTSAQRPRQAVLHDRDSGRTEKILLSDLPDADAWREVLAEHSVLTPVEGEQR